MHACITSVFLFISAICMSQELIHTFENINNPELKQVADEGLKWVGFNHAKTEYYVLNQDYTLRASFLIDFEADDDHMYQIEPLKYLQDSSDELLLAYHMWDESYNVLNRVRFRLINENGDELISRSNAKSFYCNLVGPKKSELVLDYPSSNQSFLFRHGNLEDYLPFYGEFLRFDYHDDELNYFFFNDDHFLVKTDAYFNPISEQDFGIDSDNHITELINFSKHIFIADDKLEWFLEIYDPDNGSGFKRNKVMNEDGIIFYNRSGTQYNQQIIEVSESHSYFIERKNDHHDIYRIPGMHFLGDLFGDFVQPVRISKDEYGIVAQDFPNFSEIHGAMYIEIDNSLAFSDSINIYLEEPYWFPYIASVSRDFFDSDPELEIIYRFDSIGPHYLQLYFTDENLDPFYFTTGNQVVLFYGDCNATNEFLIKDSFSGSSLNAKIYKIGDAHQYNISPFAIGSKVKYFPNPSTDWVEFQWGDGSKPIESLELFDNTGRQVLNFWSYRCSNNVAYIDMKHLAAGTYLARIQMNNEIEVVRLLKQ